MPRFPHLTNPTLLLIDQPKQLPFTHNYYSSFNHHGLATTISPLKHCEEPTKWGPCCLLSMKQPELFYVSVLGDVPRLNELHKLPTEIRTQSTFFPAVASVRLLTNCLLHPYCTVAHHIPIIRLLFLFLFVLKHDFSLLFLSMIDRYRSIYMTNVHVVK